ncbi:MAG: L-aspartate oxidase [Acidimicrobiales bacterium]|nr:L-aspartate oxidase [Acidimicrobiales bacterium]
MAALDLLVIGSGVSGLSAAVRASSAHRLRVGVITKGQLHQTTTRWAQGGVAAVLGGTDDPDSTDLHLADTLAAGAGLCDIDAVRVLVDEGPRRVSELIAMGAIFDRNVEGDYLKAREGGHSEARILHSRGDATGAEIERALVVAVHDTAASLVEHAFADSLLMDNDRCVGVRYQNSSGALFEMEAKNVLLAAGGAGQLYSVTTNPVEATGDGIAMALSVGAALGDVEFVQFHPTALHHEAMPRPLLSEALRGHGALLRDTNGDRFVDELQPRDVVSRAMMRTMLQQGVEHLYLDATGLEDFAIRFPTIHRSLEIVGLDARTDLLPIAPAAHYTCGGVITDMRGATTVPGLWAAGEVACSGVHGANRLASNSLLEGMVFGPRAVDAIAAGGVPAQPSGAMRTVLTPHDARVRGARLDPPPLPVWGSVDTDPVALRGKVQAAMTRGAGVLRDASSLAETAAALEELMGHVPAADSDPAWLEIRNLIIMGRAVVSAAANRTESRGAHTREDFPETSDDWMLRQVMVRA